MTPEQIEELFKDTLLNTRALYNRVTGYSEDKIYNFKTGRSTPELGDMLSILYQLNLIKVTEPIASEFTWKSNECEPKNNVFPPPKNLVIVNSSIYFELIKTTEIDEFCKIIGENTKDYKDAKFLAETIIEKQTNPISKFKVLVELKKKFDN